MRNIIFTRLADLLSPNDLNIPKGAPDNVFATVLKIVFSIAGAISLLVITIAGLRLVLSLGNPDTLNRAKNTVIYAAVGLVICITGFTLVTFVIGHL